MLTSICKGLWSTFLGKKKIKIVSEHWKKTEVQGKDIPVKQRSQTKKISLQILSYTDVSAISATSSWSITMLFGSVCEQWLDKLFFRSL